MSLLAHCDTKYLEESEVRAVPAPKWTNTWHPVSHAQLIDATAAACKDLGIDVKERRYSMNKSGSRMFGAWTLALGNTHIGYTVGFRHANDKSLGIGFVAGTNVFICDNMCFSGEFIGFRMHTSGLDLDELQFMAQKALSGAVVKMDKLLEWQKSLNHLYVPGQDLKQLVFDFATKGVFSGGQIGNYLSCLDEEKAVRRGYNLDGATSLYSVHGAATRLMRGWNMLRSSEATVKLNSICDDYMISRAA